ncbi:lanthionine synthetase C family protein [Frankia sp. Cas3]|uniref:lanthionine synthetase C family protein n=1 Tax=Frankia sp. Cas3 TaxID=3073926 RepID=UPI002AD2ABE4|nr:lanthionine synthetase C family protein [Frankia sp. Cas3]
MATSTTSQPGIAQTVDLYAARLALPEPPPENEPWAPQSLTSGAAGIALLHIERAHAGHGTWQQAHSWIRSAVAGHANTTDNTGLYLGAPAITFMLGAAAADDTGHYRGALADVDGHVAAIAHRRADAAMARITTGALPGFREYDVFFGLSGIGALLLRRDPRGSAMERILDYLVALSKPHRVDGEVLPGWWVGHDPHRRLSPAYRGGHGNLGMAHGISGPLALLSQAMRRGITVDGQHEAITAICAWLDAWRQDGEAGPWWPEWITLSDLRRGRASQPSPARPSWCYGTPGLARAGQLAGLALGDARRQQTYEQVLVRCLDDSVQLGRIKNGGLCHGWAGVYQTVWRAAHDAATPTLADHLPRLAENLVRCARLGLAAGPGLLDGAAGTALALHSAAHTVAPLSRWDACLLID